MAIVRWSSPVAVRGAPKAQGLMNGSVPADHETVSLSHVCHLVFACGGVNPRLEPIARVRPLVAQTYIRSGLPHTKLPHALLRAVRVAGARELWIRPGPATCATNAGRSAFA